MSATRTQPRGPYAVAAFTYSRNGWAPLPLPARRKSDPPPGYTGAHGIDPSGADIAAWCDGPEAGGNVAIRLPHNVIGIDVDAYGSKLGGTTIRLAAEKLGPLPPTWRSTSREDGSGIALYRVPGGLAWRGQVGPDVEIIQHRHRYVVAPPSIHPSGATYRWITGDGQVSEIGPTPDELVTLPAAWVAAYCLGTAGSSTNGSGDGGGPVAAIDTATARAWLDSLPGGDACRAVHIARSETITALAAGSRHDAALRATLRYARLAHEGHTGVRGALAIYLPAWVDACRDPGRGERRDEERISVEWNALLCSAIAIVSADGPPATFDPCERPFAGIMADGGPTTAELSAGLSAGSSAGLSVTMAGVTAMAGRSPDALYNPAMAGGPTNAVPGPQNGAQQPATEPALELNGSGSLLSPAAVQLAGLERWTEQQARAYLDNRLLEVLRQTERTAVRQEARTALDQHAAAAAFSPPTGPRHLPDLLALPEQSQLWRVESLLPIGGNVVLAAQYKAGKTTMMVNLAAALADGRTFLGAFPPGAAGDTVDLARVAMWNYEVSESMFTRWLRAANIANPANIEVLNLRGQSSPLASGPGQEWAAAALREERIDVWIVDPFAGAFKGDENDNGAVTAWLEILDSIKASAGVSELIVVAHTGRASGERVRGATRLDDWPDVRWLLSRDDEDQRFFSADGREVTVPEGRLSYTGETHRLTFHFGEDRKSTSLGTIQAAVIECIRHHPGCGSRAVRDFCRNALGSASSQRVDDAVRALVSQGLVIKTSAGSGMAAEHTLNPDFEEDSS